MLDSEFMNLHDDFRPNNNFSCWISDSLIKICLVQSRVKINERTSYTKRNPIPNLGVVSSNLAGHAKKNQEKILLIIFVIIFGSILEAK